MVYDGHMDNDTQMPTTDDCPHELTYRDGRIFRCLVCDVFVPEGQR